MNRTRHLDSAPAPRALGLALLALLALVVVACGTNPGRQSQTFGNSSPPSAAAAVEFPDVGAPISMQQASPNDVAVVVAIEDYAFLPDVAGATANGEAWRRFLEDSLGVRRVFTLWDRDASNDQIAAFAQRAANAVGPGGTVWFVFIGHGAPSSGGDGLLVGMDAQQTVDSLNSRSIGQSKLVTTLRDSQAARVVMVVDACFSGRDGSGELLAQGTQPVVPVEELHVPSRVVMLSAARSNEFAGALPNTPRPAFSYLLLGALRGWADDGDGTVRADEALRWTREQLAYVPGRTQTPTLLGDRSVALTSGVGEPDPGIADAMRGRPAPVAAAEAPSTAQNVLDTRRGMTIVVPDGYEVTTSVPPGFSDEDPLLFLEIRGGPNDLQLGFYVKKDGASALAGNVRQMQDTWENHQGATFLRQRGITVDGRDALLQLYRTSDSAGSESLRGLHVTMIFVPHGDDLIFTMGTTGASGDEVEAEIMGILAGVSFE